MRRGLLAWSEAEVSAAEFGRRLTEVRAQAKAQGIDAVLVYSNFARTGALSHLTNVVPFWSEAMLVVPSETHETTLVVGLPNRDVGVIRPTGFLDHLICNPDARSTLVKVLQDAGLLNGTLAIINEADCPAPFAAELVSARNGRELACFVGGIDPLDDDGSTARLQEHAARIARNAVAATSIAADSAEIVVAAVELQARLSGVEEVQVLIAPDLTRNARLKRIEGHVALGDRFGVSISLAYKGQWVRVGRSIARGPIPDEWTRTDAAIAGIAAGLTPDGQTDVVVRQALGDSAGRWSLEGVAGANPLQLLAHSREPDHAPLRAGQLVVFSAWTDTPAGSHFAAATARVGHGLLLC